MSKTRPYPRRAVVRRPPPVPRGATPSRLHWPIVVGGAALGGLLLTLVTLTAWVRAHAPAAKAHPPAAIQPATLEVARQALPALDDDPKLPLAQDPVREDPPTPAGPAPVAAIQPEPAAVAALPGLQNDPPAAAGADPAASACQNFGTAVDFLGNPADAARQADKTRKLLFVLHISGNFECDRFT